MHRHLHRLSLSLMLTVGVIAWNQQQTHSFSQSRHSQSAHSQPMQWLAHRPSPILIDLIQKAAQR